VVEVIADVGQRKTYGLSDGDEVVFSLSGGR
jgi:CTP-dependent riboflavin kinase